METLNRNQRRSALIRLNALGFFILSLIFVVLLSMCNAYEGNGNEDYEKQKAEYEQAKEDLVIQVSQLKNENASLKKLIKEQENPDKAMEIQELRLKAKDDEIKKLDRELKQCQAQLSQFN